MVKGLGRHGNDGLGILYLEGHKASRAVHVLFGDLLLPAHQNELGLVALARMGMALVLGKFADEDLLLLIAAVVMRVKRALGQRAHEVAVFVVALVSVSMGNGTRCVAVEGGLLMRGSHSALLDDGGYAEGDHQRDTGQNCDGPAPIL